uniref:Integrase catalytic domain-containing protein n=1 Tax=Cannabis sativa TaxID=3483 RepID=A0A803PCP8_CANSA
MGLQVKDLVPCTQLVYGFSDQSVAPLGQIRLPLIVGQVPRSITVMAQFLVIDVPSAFNVMLCRLALYDLQFITSVFHRVPYKIITDNRTQFEGYLLSSYCSERSIERGFSAVVHPQANGQVEAANKVIKKNLKTNLENLKGRWVDELPNVPWAYRTTPRSTTGKTPFSLAYGCEAVLPVEMNLNSFHVNNFNKKANEKAMAENLDLLEERRDATQMRLEVY